MGLFRFAPTCSAALVLVTTVFMVQDIGVSSAWAGIMSAQNDSTDDAITYCIRKNFIHGSKTHTPEQSLRDLDVYKIRCETPLKNGMFKCQTSGKTSQECAWGLAAFLNEIIDNTPDE